jgi:hypothetical protein
MDKMKCLALWELDLKDMDKISEKNIELSKLREKSPEKYMKLLYPNHTFVGELQKGFAVVEGTEEQLLQWANYYRGLGGKFKFIPVVESAKALEMIS